MAFCQTTSWAVRQDKAGKIVGLLVGVLLLFCFIGIGTGTSEASSLRSSLHWFLLLSVVHLSLEVMKLNLGEKNGWTFTLRSTFPSFWFSNQFPYRHGKFGPVFGSKKLRLGWGTSRL